MKKAKKKGKVNVRAQSGSPGQTPAQSRFFAGNGYLIFSVVLLLGVVIPLLMMFPFLTPAADDFSYAALARQASAAGGGWGDILAAALQQVKISYETWQGTYSSLFLFSFTSIVKNFVYYKWEVLFIQLVFLGGIALLAYQLLRFFGVMERKNAFASALLAVAFVIVCIPGVGEGLMWRNSMVIYSLAIGAQGITIAFMLFLYRAGGTIRKIIWMLPILLLLAYLGGSNYITALCMCFGLFLLCAWMYWRKEAHRWYFTVMFFVSLAGLLITVAAPGNSGRALYFRQNDPITAVLLSLPGAFQFLFMTLRDSLLIPVTVILVLAALPALRKSTFKFHYPLVVAGISFLFLAAHFTPTLYAASSTFFELRIKNTYFISLCFLFVINAIYITGWCLARGLDKDYAPAETRVGLGVLCAISIFIFALSFQPSENSYTALWHDVLTPAGRDYHNYVIQTCETIEASDVMDLAVPRYDSIEPWALNSEFLMPDATDWRNYAVQIYFQKNSVQLLS